MTLYVDHDVSVVTVFHLQNVAHQTVSRQRVTEVLAGSFVRLGVLFTVLKQEEVSQSAICLLYTSDAADE